MKVILRTYDELIKQNKEDEAKQVVLQYGQELEKRGWIENVNEGAFISPDYSTSFIYNKLGCYGELVKYKNTKASETGYKIILENLKNDFIIDGIIVNDENNSINNINKVVEVVEKSKPTFKLNESFSKLDNLAANEVQLKERITIFLNQNKGNEILEQYIAMEKELNETKEKLEEGKKDLYDPMRLEDIDELNGTFINCTLVKPYIKRQINGKEFFKLIKPTDKLYKQVVEEKEVKGHINLKKIEE